MTVIILNAVWLYVYIYYIIYIIYIIYTYIYYIHYIYIYILNIYITNLKKLSLIYISEKRFEWNKNTDL